MISSAPEELLQLAVAQLTPLVGADRLAVYLTGSQASGDGGVTSDVDAVALWPLDPARRVDVSRVAEATWLAWHLSDRRLDLIALGISDFRGLLYDWMVPGLIRAGRRFCGPDVAGQLPLPSSAEYLASWTRGPGD